MHLLTSKLARLVLPLILALVFVPQAVQAAQSLSPVQDGYNTNADALVLASVIQPDGKLIIAGRHGAVKNGDSTEGVGPAYLTRVNTDGSADTTFAPGFNGAVTALALQADGSVIVAGEFSSTGGQDHLHVARLTSEGKVDSTFTPGLRHLLGAADSKDFRVYSIVVQKDGKIVLGGFFNTYVNGGTSTTISNLVRLNKDGSLDTTFALSANNVVKALLLRSDGTLLVGGGFTTLTKGTTAVTRNRMARILADGSIDTTFDPNFDDRVNAMMVTSDGSLLVAGFFATVQPIGASAAVNARFLVRLKSDGTYATGYHVNANGEVLSLGLQSDGKILLGGYFTSLTYGNPSSTYYQSYLGRLNPNGSPDTSFYSGINYAVTTISVQGDNKIVVGGYFDRVTPSGESFGMTANHVARFYPDGSLDRDFTSARLGTASFSLPLPDGRILVGGSFTNIGGVTRTYLAILSADGVVDPTFAPVLDGAVYTASRLSDGRFYIGGSFGSVNGTVQRYAALLKADGKLDTSFAPSIDGPVYDFGIQSDGKIVIAGAFSSVGDLTRTYLARVSADGSVDSTYDPRPSSTVRSVRILANDVALVGGSFTYFQKDGGTSYTSAYYITKVKTDGSVDTSFTLALNNEVYTIQPVGDGSYYLGGAFSGLAVLSPDKSTVSYVYGLAKLKADWTLDHTFAPYVTGTVTKVQVMSDKRLIISGSFTGVIDHVRYYLARINPDATLDTTYDPYPNGQISTISVLSDNSILAGGNFTQFWPNGTTTGVKAGGVAVINVDGTISSSFKVKASTASAGRVNTITRQSDGRILVGGQFDGIGGSQSANLARVYPDGHLDMSLGAKLNGAVNTVANWSMKDSIIGTYGAYSWLNTEGTLSKVDPLKSEQISGYVNAVVFQADGKAVIGGNFTLPNHTAYKNLVRINADGTLDTTFNPAPDAAVYALVLQSDGKLLVGGQFTTIASASPSFFARLNADGSIDSTITTHPNSTVISILPLSDGSIILGGSFTGIYNTTDSGTTTRNYLAKVKKDGSFDTTFTPTTDAQVNALALQSDGNIIVAGNFTYLAPTGNTSYSSRNYIARIKPDGTLDESYYPTPNSSVTRVMVTTDDKLYVAGTMQTFLPNGASTSINRQGLARLNKDGTIDTDFNVQPNSAVNMICIQADGTLVVGGSFSIIGKQNRNYLARISPAGVVLGSGNLLPVATGAPTCLANDRNGGLFIGGRFSNDRVDPTMLVGGSFTAVSNISAPYLARLYTDGTADSSFAATPNGVVHAIIRLADGRFLVGGEFTKISGTDAKYLVMLKADGSIDTSFTTQADAKVLALASLPDGRILVGGSFNSIGGVGHSRLAMLKADGTVDTSYAADADGDVTGIIATPTAIYVSGSFNRVGTGTTKYFAVTSLTGSTDKNPLLSLDGPVNSFSVDADGAITLAGTFSKVLGQSRAGFAHLLASGALDTNNVVQGANGLITAVFAQEDGKVLLGGSFTTIDGLDRFMLARVSVLSAANQSLVYDTNTRALVWSRSGGLPQLERASFEYSTDGSTWSALGSAPAAVGTVTLSNITLPSDLSFVYFRARGLVRSAPHGSQGWVELSSTAYMGGFPALPTFGTLVLETAATPTLTLPTLSANVSLSFSGLPTGISYDATTNKFVGSAKYAGTYTVTWSITDGYVTRTYTQTWIVSNASGGTALTASQRLINISARMDLTGSEAGVAGFIVSGSAPKRILVRAVGPTLKNFNISDVVARPRMRLMNSSQVQISSTAAWDSSSTMAAEFNRLGAFPLISGSADSAFEVTLDPGLYTVLVDDLAAVGGTVIMEVYDASANALTESQRLVNLSARGPVTGSSHVIVGGLVIGGSDSQRILLRAPGPTLASHGVTDAVADSVIKVYDSSNNLVATNDNWEVQTQLNASYQPAVLSDLTAAQSTAGAFGFTTGSKDAALLLTLPNGLYTVIVSSTSATKGTAMVEIYQLQK